MFTPEESPAPRPMEWPTVPPFLSKTYDLVEEAGLDGVLSWGPTGESFVVWDPFEFSRSVLPFHFKHNNFSSFVRQLNTYVAELLMICITRERKGVFLTLSNVYPSGELHLLKGFRKIDTDKWEFANESFRRGQKHLLKNIQRRKSPQSQPVGLQAAGPSLETGISGLEGEVERLKKDKSRMMEEVVELRQQQHGTVQHVGEANRRLRAAEQKQKQMLSFLSKLFQNPEFLGRLRQQKEQGLIGSPRMKRRFISHQTHGAGQTGPSLEDNVVPEANYLHMEPTTDYVLQDVGPGAGDMPFQINDIAFQDLAVSDELAKAQGLISTTELAGEGMSSFGREDRHFKGKSIATPEQEINTEYSLSFPEEFSGKEFLEFQSPQLESMVKQEDLWNLGLDDQTGMSSSSGEPFNYGLPEFGSTAFSDIWDMGSVQEAGASGIDLWPAEELDGGASHTVDDRTMNKDP